VHDSNTPHHCISAAVLTWCSVRAVRIDTCTFRQSHLARLPTWYTQFNAGVLGHPQPGVQAGVQQLRRQDGGSSEALQLLGIALGSCSRRHRVCTSFSWYLASALLTPVALLLQVDLAAPGMDIVSTWAPASSMCQVHSSQPPWACLHPGDARPGHLIAICIQPMPRCSLQQHRHQAVQAGESCQPVLPFMPPRLQLTGEVHDATPAAATVRRHDD
jgi:hypothetical protein